jgi:hypothetical protein
MLVRSHSPSKSESDSSMRPYSCEMNFSILDLIYGKQETEKTTIFNAFSHEINNLLIAANVITDNFSFFSKPKIFPEFASTLIALSAVSI